MVSKNSKRMRHTGPTMDGEAMHQMLSIRGLSVLRYMMILVVSVLLLACDNNDTTRSAVPGKLDINAKIGWVHKQCLAIKNNEIKQGEVVTLISFDTEQRIVHGSILKKAEDGTKCPPLLEDRKLINQSEGNTFYAIKTDSNIDLAIGLIGESTKLEKSNGLVTVDINNDGKPDYFNQCASSEGIHFSITTDKKLAGQTIWSGYYYLGYDIEPNCPQKNDE